MVSGWMQENHDMNYALIVNDHISLVFLKTRRLKKEAVLFGANFPEESNQYDQILHAKAK